MDEDLVSPLFLYPQKDYRIPGGVKNETLRAQGLIEAIDRRLRQGYKPLGNGSFRFDVPVPAIGRKAGIGTFYESSRKSLSTIGFDSLYGPPEDLNLADPRRNPSDNPFKGGLKDTKLKGLQYLLGALIDEVPAYGTVDGAGLDQRRTNVYNRRTGGALGPEGRGYRRPDGRFQGFDKNKKFMKAVPSPKARLQAPLLKLANAPDPVYSVAKPLLKIVTKNPYAQAYYNFEELMQSITGKSPTREVLKGTRNQLTDTLTQDERANVGPILPF
jgi:hypothetical protein